MSVFIDTSAILATSDAQDPRHKQASEVWASLLQSDEELITSSYVVLETIALLHSRFGTSAVAHFAAKAVPAMSVVWVDSVLHNLALAVLLARTGKQGPSIVDCVTIELVRTRRVERLFAYDRHFANIGCALIG